MLLGSYFIHWNLTVDSESDSKVCCTAKFKVDDKYDFHLGKDASFTIKKKKTVTIKGITFEATARVRVKVPDSLVIQMSKALGAKDFERVTEWEKKITVDKDSSGNN